MKTLTVKLQDVIPTIIDEFFKQELLPEIIQNSGLALLTIIIAVAIFLAERGTAFDFDRKIIVNNIVRAKQFLTAVIFIFLPLLFWNLASESRLLLFLLPSVGIGLLIRILYRAYKWMDVFESAEYRNTESYRMKLRLQYLGDLADSEEKVGVWSYILKLKPRSPVEERKFIGAFIKSVKSLIEKRDDESLELAARNLNVFQSAIDHVSLDDWAIFEDVIKTILQIRYEARDYKRSGLRAGLHLYTTLNSLLGLLVKKALQVGVAYVLFEELKKHFQSIDDKEYIQRVVEVVSGSFFENVADSPESYDIWESYFPSKWKVTKETVTDKNNIIAQCWMKDFFKWAGRRIQEYADDWDKKLDEMSRGLFPTVDPITWSIILTFLARQWTGNKRMKALVEKPRKFGFASHVIEETEEEVFGAMEEQRRNAIELALMLFPSKFTKEKLENYIGELSSLSYEPNTREADDKVEVEQIFKEMLKFLDK